MRGQIKRHGNFFVYIVQCSHGTYYAGYTSNLESRIKLHNSGQGAKYLRGKLPVQLVYSKEYKYYKNALRAEKTIKKLPRNRKEELIRNYENNRVHVFR